MFQSVNVVGTANLLLADREAQVREGRAHLIERRVRIPDTNPVTEDTPCRPLKEYGRSKLAGELLCREAVDAGLDVTIIRPCPILGHGRLGTMVVLFEFFADGVPAYVLNRGTYRYQLVHASDLADACRLAEARGSTTSMDPVRDEPRDVAGARRSCRDRLGAAVAAGRADTNVDASLPGLGLAPFAPYHWLVYGESIWFAVTRAQAELGWVR